MMLAITFDQFLSSLAELEQEGVDAFIERMPGLDSSALRNLDLAALVSKYRRVGDVMTQEERADPSVITPRRLKQIAQESGCPLDEMNRLVQAFQRLHRATGPTPGQMIWHLLGLSRFRPPPS